MQIKGTMIVAIIALILIVGAGVAVMKNKTNTTAPTTQVTQTQTQTNTTTTQPSAQKSLKDLLETGSSQKCTFTNKTDTIEMSGTSYVVTDRMRTDYSNSMQGKTSTGHMILNGNTMYTWMDGVATGTQMTLNPKDETAPSIDAQIQKQISANAAVNFTCAPWVLDGTQFVPPTSVTFTDVSAMMKATQPTGTTQTGTGTNAAACNACSSLTGDAQVQCKSALHCN